MIRHERGRSFYPIPDELSTPFHGGNTGSSPVGRANDFNALGEITLGSGRAYGKNTAYSDRPARSEAAARAVISKVLKLAAVSLWAIGRP
jgi:hypothetical protein